MAGNRSLGTLTIDLIAKVGGFKAGLDKAGRDAQKAASDIDRTLSTIGKNALWAGGILAGAFSSAATALSAFGVQMTTTFAATSRELTTFASISNLSVENFQKYAAAAQSVGISNEKMADQFKDVNERLGEYIATGKGPLTDFIDEYGSRVGTTAEALQKLNDPMLVLTKIVADMQALGASDQEISFVLESLASDTTNLIPLLKNGAEGMKDYVAAMEQIGFLSSDQVAAGREVAKQLDLVRAQYDLLKNKIAAELAPAVIALIQDFQSWITEGNNAKNVADLLAMSMDIVRVAFHGAAVVIEGTTAVVKTFVADVMLAINLVTGLGKLAALSNPLVAAGQVAQGGLDGYIQNLNNTQAKVREQLAADVRYRETVNAAGASRAQKAWEGATKAVSDSWNNTSQSAKKYNEVVQAGTNGPIGALNEALKTGNRLTADQLKARAKAEEQQKRENDAVEKQIAQERVRAQTIGQNSRALELEAQIREGLVKGTEDQLNRLREAARLADTNTAAVEARKKAEQEAQKSARAGESAAKKAAADAEREAKKREQEAKRLQDAYDNQVLSLERSIYMIGKEGEAAAIAWEISKGEFKDYSEQQKQHLMLLAQNVDAAQKAFDVEKKAREEAAKKLEDEADRQEDANKKYKEYLDDVQHNLNLLGKSADEQERLNALKDLGIDADSEAGKVLTETLKIYQEQRKAVEDQVAAMDELRSSFSDALSDWVSGTKSFKDAFKDALDQIQKRIINLIADRWIEKLFGSFGSNEGGKVGGPISGFLGKLFGVKDPEELQNQINGIRGEGDNQVLPYDPQNIESLRQEAKRMTDGVIAVHQEAANSMASSVGTSTQTAADGALSSIDETTGYAKDSMDAAVGGANSEMESESKGFIGILKDTFSNMFNNEGGGWLSTLSKYLSNIGNAISGIFSSFGKGGAGGGDNGWLSVVSSFFSGGRANGGPVSAGRMYRVNENMPEMLTIGNQDFLMMGGQNGRVSNASGSGMQQVNNFVIHGRIDRRTESQIAQDVGQRTQRAITRNS